MFYSSVGNDIVNGFDDNDGMRAIIKKVEKGFKIIGVVFGSKIH